jgi:hypothetical protein
MTNDTKQTAVEWLSEKVLHREYELLTQEKKRKILEQAKEMEKEQIKSAHGEEQSKLQDDGSWKRQTAEQYYNETYGGNK